MSGFREHGSEPWTSIKGRDALDHLEACKHFKDYAILYDFIHTFLALIFVCCNTNQCLCAFRFACPVQNMYDMLMLKTPKVRKIPSLLFKKSSCVANKSMSLGNPNLLLTNTVVLSSPCLLLTNSVPLLANPLMLLKKNPRQVLTNPVSLDLKLWPCCEGCIPSFG